MDSSGRTVVAASTATPVGALTVPATIANRLLVLQHITEHNREAVQMALYNMFELRKGAVPGPHFSREVRRRRTRPPRRAPRDPSCSRNKRCV